MAKLDKILAAHKEPVVSASEVAALAGLHPFTTELDLYLWKAGLVERPGADSDAAEWGMILEPTILQQYAVRTGSVVLAQDPASGRAFYYRPDGTQATYRSKDYHLWDGDTWAYLVTDTLRHLDFPMICHLDGVAMDKAIPILGQPCQPYKVVQAKAPTFFGGKNYGDEGTDEVPAYVLMQVQQEMLILGAVTGCKVGGDVPTLAGGSRWRVFPQELDTTVVGRMTKLAVEFRRRLDEGDMPDADRSERGTASLKSLWPVDSGDELVVEPGSGLDAAVQRLRGVKAALKDAEAAEAAAKVGVQELMGDLSVLVGDKFRVTWKRSKDGVTIDWQGLAKKLGATDEQVATFSMPKLGTRSFRPTFK